MSFFIFLLLIGSQFQPGLSKDDRSVGKQENAKTLAVVDISRMNEIDLKSLKSSRTCSWWVENGEDLLVLVKDSGSLMTYPVKHFFDHTREMNLRFAKTISGNKFDFDWRVLSDSGVFQVIEVVNPELFSGAELPRSIRNGDIFLWPFKPNTVLVKKWSHQKTLHKTGGPFQFLVDEVDDSSWYSAIETLASYNRYTYNAGVLDARDWLVDQFNSLPGLTVSTDVFNVGSTHAYNVMAVLPGTTRPDDWYIVGAHYDSTSQSPSMAAPGAEDNASGTAGVLEMARIFSSFPPDSTIIFICFSAEEQGLFGSKFHVNQLASSGNTNKVKAVINMDMIGFTADAELDCLLETRTFAADLSSLLGQAAQDYTQLVIYTTFNAWGSDHVPYLDVNIPAILTIENDYASYPGYHRTTDIPENITLSMGRETLKMNVAALAEMVYSKADFSLAQVGLQNAGTNSQVDPGETPQMTLTLQNEGHIGAQSISGTLISQSPGVSVIQSFSEFQDCDAGFQGSNLTPFQIFVSTDFPCGDPISLELQLEYFDGFNRTVSLPVELQTGELLGEVHFSVSPSLAIPDNQPGISSPLTISQSSAVVSNQFSVDVDITHSYIGDLEIDLESPAGTIVRLWNQDGGSAHNLIGNFPNSLTPAGSLADFQGEAIQGTWLLHVADVASGDSGTLNQWGINDSQGYECESYVCGLYPSISSLQGSGNVECAGQTLDLICETQEPSTGYSFEWSLIQGGGTFEGGTDSSSAIFQAFNDSTVQCRIFNQGCEETDVFGISVEKVSVPGNRTISLDDLYFIIDTYWLGTGPLDPKFDVHADGQINILDFVEFSNCL